LADHPNALDRLAKPKKPSALINSHARLPKAAWFFLYLQHFAAPGNSQGPNKHHLYSESEGDGNE